MIGQLPKTDTVRSMLQERVQRLDSRRDRIHRCNCNPNISISSSNSSRNGKGPGPQREKGGGGKTCESESAIMRMQNQVRMRHKKSCANGSPTRPSAKKIQSSLHSRMVYLLGICVQPNARHNLDAWSRGPCLSACIGVGSVMPPSRPRNSRMHRQRRAQRDDDGVERPIVSVTTGNSTSAVLGTREQFEAMGKKHEHGGPA